MEIPSNIAARISQIVSRFEPAALTEPSGSQFASTLAGTLSSGTLSSGTLANGSLSSVLGASTGTTDLESMISQATASRTSALGLRSAAYGSAGRIASKAEVVAIEGRYENGRLPDEALTSIGVGSHRLSPVAADAFTQLRSAAAAQGIEIGVTDSYRSYDAQVDVARRKGLYSQGGLAARPGTSDHGLGLAVDLDLDSQALAWMRQNAGRFGFVEDTPRETWHWKFDGV